MKNYEMHHYFKLYKPYGYLSQFVNRQNKRRYKKLLGELYDFPEGIMAVGRLDEKSEGLLLLTTDGRFSHHILSSGIEKEYYTMVDGIITNDAIEALAQGVIITVDGDDYTTQPCKVEAIETPATIPDRFVRHPKHGPTSWIAITLTEGKHRQVRKMTAIVGYPTLRLVRVRVGEYGLGHLKPGDIELISYPQI